MAGDNSYKPGEIVKVSGIYSVVHEDGKERSRLPVWKVSIFRRRVAGKARTSS